MEDLRIVHVRFHEAISFEGGLATYVSTLPGANNKSRANITFLRDINCLLIEGPKSKTLVPTVNVAYMSLDSDLVKEKEEQVKKEAAKPKSTTKGHEIPRPR